MVESLVSCVERRGNAMAGRFGIIMIQGCLGEMSGGCGSLGLWTWACHALGVWPRTACARACHGRGVPPSGVLMCRPAEQ